MGDEKGYKIDDEEEERYMENRIGNNNRGEYLRKREYIKVVLTPEQAYQRASAFSAFLSFLAFVSCIIIYIRMVKVESKDKDLNPTVCDISDPLCSKTFIFK